MKDLFEDNKKPDRFEKVGEVAAMVIISLGVLFATLIAAVIVLGLLRLFLWLA